MRQYNFKMFEDEDPDLINWLDSLGRREKSMEIRRALRAYRRGQLSQQVPTGPVLPGLATGEPVLLHEADDSVLDRVVVEQAEAQEPKEAAKRNLERLKEMF